MKIINRQEYDIILDAQECAEPREHVTDVLACVQEQIEKYGLKVFILDNFDEDGNTMVIYWKITEAKNNGKEIS